MKLPNSLSIVAHPGIRLAVLCALLLGIAPVSWGKAPPRKPASILDTGPVGDLSASPAPISQAATTYGPYYQKLMNLLMPEKGEINWGAVAKKIVAMRNPLANGVEISENSVLLWQRLGFTDQEKIGQFLKSEAAGFIQPINSYVGGKDAQGVPIYQSVNDGLRGLKELSPANAKLVMDIRAGMAKLPRYEGIVMRGAVLPNDFFKENFVAGRTFTDLGFGSASVSPAIAQNFANPKFNAHAAKGEAGRTPVVLIIRSKTGRPISYFDKFSGEAEVLFANGTPLRIRSVSPAVEVTAVSDNTRIVFAEEE